MKLSVVDAGGETSTVPSLDAVGGIVGVGHRVVHGGPRFTDPTLVDDDVVQALRDLRELAPLHNEPALAALDDARARFPDVPHVAVFDTAFHATLPAVARTYALPARFRDRGIRRYGFHGISVQSVVERVPAKRLVVAHLGGGSSVTAVLDGRSVDTTMGFTPLEGVPMGSRSGSVDPGALLHLLAHGVGLDELTHALEQESGLVALAGTSDMRKLESASSTEARLAVDLYCYRVAQAVAAMAVALGGVDVLAFTGGIGARSSTVRDAVCARLGHLAVAEVVGLESHEEQVIARAVRDLLARQ
ncbi:MAG TPA: hypothetical protein VHC67_16355 [Gaiellaceae bacterium]|nr:hypothetical protein [Gaiellaceae bacterium]